MASSRSSSSRREAPASLSPRRVRWAARRLFEWTDDTVLLIGSDLSVFDANPAAIQLLGAEPAGSTFEDAIHPEDRATSVMVVEAARLAGATAAFEARAPRNPEQWIEWRILPGGPRSRSVLVIGRDATIRRVHDREIRSARDSVKRTSKLRSAFLDNLSHEIRTPLNVIVGYVSVVEDRLRESADEPADVVLEGIRRASGRLVRTIEALLDLSKVEAGVYPYRPSRVDLLFFVERTIDPFRVSAREKGLELDWILRAAGAAIEFDPRALQTALAGLIDNAIKFTDHGRIEVALERDAEGVLALEVRDTGIGIEDGVKDHLFEPFSQGEMGYARRFEGTGVGLALARRLLELGRATLEMESEVGKGTTARIRFVATRELDAVPETARSEERPMTSGEAPLKRTTALIVEDDPDTQIYMQTVLRRHYDVLLAASGDEVRRHLESKGDEIGIILMDLSLRGSEDGLQLTREIRASERFKHLPVIATTAHAFPEDRERVLAAGCNAYLAKPFNHRELLTTMADLLGKPPS